MRWASRRTFLAQAGSGLAVSGCLPRVARDQLSVFDAMWKTVNDAYFDPAMGGIDWRAIRKVWRPRAAKAATQAALYLDVLVPVLENFSTSHVEIRPPHSLVLPAGRSFRMPRQKRGSSLFMLTREDESGMGALLTWNGSAYVVEDIASGSPADAAGLQTGQLVRFNSLNYPKGRRELRVADRTGAVFSVVWSPKAAPDRTEWRGLENGAAMLRFDIFDQPSVAWAIDSLGTAASRSAVLDLRQNGGGLLIEMARFNSALLPEGSGLGMFRSRKRDYHPASGPGQAGFTGPLAVLIGPRTLSAAEITAAVLQHYGRARVFGTPSLGSVLGSETFDLPDGGRLTLPTSDYLTPAGTRLEERGVTPDVVAPRTAASVAKGADPALDAALDWLNRGQ